MATIEINDGNENESIAVQLTFEPYNGDVTINLFPKTRVLLMKAIAKGKQNPRSRRHTVRDANAKGGRRVVDGDENAAFMDELADLLIDGWEGVEQDGVPVECTRENKIRLFNNIRVSSFLLEVAEDLADTIGEVIEKNLPTS